MRRLAWLVPFVACALVAAPARADVAWRAGGDVGLFYRGEAGGNRTVLVGLSPRASVTLRPHLRLAAGYLFALAPAGDALAAERVQHHRLDARAECEWPFGAASLVVGAGPAIALTHATLFDRDTAVVSSTVVRPALAGGLALEVDLGRFRLRSGVDAFASLSRTDVLVFLGASVPFGGAP